MHSKPMILDRTLQILLIVQAIQLFSASFLHHFQLKLSDSVRNWMKTLFAFC